VPAAASDDDAAVGAVGAAAASDGAAPSAPAEGEADAVAGDVVVADGDDEGVEALPPVGVVWPAG